MQTILLTGANGFLGSVLCNAAAQRGCRVLALVREGADRSLLPVSVEVVRGDFTNQRQMSALLQEHRPSAIVHAAAVPATGKPDRERSLRVNVDGTRALLAAAGEAGVRRWIQISSMSAHPGNWSVYGRTKFLADEEVRASELDWTILQPSLIYGPQRRGIFHKLLETLKTLPVVPVVGSGREPVHPIHAEDVAAMVLAALDRPESIGRTLQLGCPERWSTGDFLRETARQVRGGKVPLVLPLPLPLCRIVALLGELLLREPPLTFDNIAGVETAREIRVGDTMALLDFTPRGYREGLAECMMLRDSPE